MLGVLGSRPAASHSPTARRAAIAEATSCQGARGSRWQGSSRVGKGLACGKTKLCCPYSVVDIACQSCCVVAGASAARLTSPADCQFTATNAHCNIVMTTGNDIALPAKSCINVSVGRQVSKRSCFLKSILSLTWWGCLALFTSGLVFDCCAAWATRPAAPAWAWKVSKRSKNSSAGNPWNSKASRPNISRAAFRGGTGSSHKFIFGSMVGAMCFPASAFQVKALARLMLWDKSRMRLPGDWTCSSGSASCSLSVKVLYHELLETLGCAPWPHLTRKDSAIFMWWSAHSVLEGFSCWLSSSRRCIRWVKSASTAGSSSAKRASEAQGPCLTHPDKRPPNAEKMDPRFYPGRTAKDLLPPTPKRRTSAGGVQASQNRCCLWGQAGLRTHGLPFGCMRNTSMLDWPPVFPLHAKENKNFSHGISQSKRKQVSISFVIYVNWKLILDYIASNHCCTASDIGISLYFIA